MGKIFVMIKPWSIDHSERILSELDGIGRRLETIKVDSIPEDAMRLQHIKYEGESFFQLMIDDLVGQQCIIALYDGNQDDFNRQKLILRERFIRDIPKLPPIYIQGALETIMRNAIHISSSEQEFDRDYNAWRAYLNEY